MHFTHGDVYHIYNRGNHKQPIFFDEANYLFFLNKVKRELAPVADILGYCLMPNHFHLLIHANEQSCKELAAFADKSMQQLAATTGKVLSSYSRAINKQNGTTGSLFQQKTKAKSVAECIQEDAFHGSRQDYLVWLLHYFHQNPQKAGLVSKMEDWKYSSFLDYCQLRADPVCNQQLFFEMANYHPVAFYEESYAIWDARTR